MKDAIEQTLKEENINNVKVVIYDTLTVEEAKKSGADILIRGLRNGTDYEYEENVASVNEVHAGFDTCYFRAGNLGYISSSIVMDLFKHGENIERYVPQAVNKVILENKK